MRKCMNIFMLADIIDEIFPENCENEAEYI